MVNQLINIFWTVDSFIVVGSYWGEYIAEKELVWPIYICIVVSILGFLVPNRWLSTFTLSTNPQTYERIGVKVVLWFVQNGKLVNRIERAYGRRARKVTRLKTIKVFLKTTTIAERYHFSCLIFFGLSTVSALSNGKIRFALYIMFWNIIYNVYPILLQQYIRLRINIIMSRRVSPEHDQHNSPLSS